MKYPSQDCYALIKKFEGIYLKAYLCPANIPTIGYGTIVYPSGEKVKIGDEINQAQADEYLEHEVRGKTKGVYDLIDTETLTQHQFDSLVSFAYNVGLGALKSSTLLKKAKVNPNDETIRDEFMKWNKAAKKVLPGLTRRRQAEADLYFS